jgi:membrane dipeptidase
MNPDSEPTTWNDGELTQEATVKFTSPSGTLSRRDCLRVTGSALGAVAAGMPATAAPPSGPAVPQPETKAEVSARALALTRDAIVIDAYNCGGTARHRETPGWFTRRGEAQVDLIKAIEGGVSASGISMGDGVRSPHANIGGFEEMEARVKEGKTNWQDYSWPPADGRPYAQYDFHRSSLANALMGLEIFLRELSLASDRAMLVTQGSQIRQARKEGKVAIILHANTVTMFEDSLEVFHVFHRLGVRMVILARAGRNLICDGYTEGRTNSKLTTFGVRVVKEMNRLGMVIDASHMSDSSFYDALEISEQPVICSHSNSRALCRYPRNLTDDQMKALARRGGVMCLTFVPGFISIEAPEGYQNYTPSSPLFMKWVDHCDRAMQLIGADHIGLGSDFDGGGNLMKDMSQWPFVTEALLRRGYSETDIRKILGGNLLRIFEQVIRG